MTDPLPQKAEKIVQDRTVDLNNFSRQEIQQLIHQLLRRQDALVLENETLRRTQAAQQVTLDDLKRRLEERPAARSEEQEADKVAFPALVDYPLQGMVILKDDRLIFINRMLTEMLGYRAEELLGMTFDELSRRTIHPDDRPWVIQRLRNRLGDQPAPARYELRVIRKDGTIRWLEQFVGHITYEGEPALQVVSIDITKRKQMEEALRESEEKFRSIIEQSSDGIVLTDGQGRIIEMNRSYERLTGLARAEMLDQFFWDVQFKLVPDEFKTPEIHQKTREQILHFFETGQADWMNRLLERRIQTLDGTVRHVQSTVFPVRQEDKIVMIGGIIRDVSEQKQAEEALRRSEARYRLLVENAPLGIVSIDQAGNIVDINDKFLELLGSPSSEFTRSVNVLTFPPIVKAGISDDFRRCLESGALVVKERWYRSHWGKAIYLRYHLAALRDAQDRIIGV
jgi:PAS domain S-box-containing protein